MAKKTERLVILKIDGGAVLASEQYAAAERLGDAPTAFQLRINDAVHAFGEVHVYAKRSGTKGGPAR